MNPSNAVHGAISIVAFFNSSCDSHSILISFWSSVIFGIVHFAFCPEIKKISNWIVLNNRYLGGNTPTI